MYTRTETVFTFSAKLKKDLSGVDVTRIRSPHWLFSSYSARSTSPAATATNQGADTLKSDALARRAVLSCCGVARLGLLCAAFASPQLLPELQEWLRQLGRCKCSPIQAQWGDATARRNSTTLGAASLSVCSQPQGGTNSMQATTLETFQCPSRWCKKATCLVVMPPSYPWKEHRKAEKTGRGGKNGGSRLVAFSKREVSLNENSAVQSISVRMCFCCFNQ